MRYFKGLLVILALSVFLISPSYAKSSDKPDGYKSCDKKHGKEKWGNERGSYGQSKHGQMMSKLLSSLDLSDDQLKDIKKFRLEYKKKTIRMQADLEVAGLELRELLMAEEVDLKAVEAKLHEVAASKTNLKFYRIKMFEELKRDKLNDKQRKKLQEIMSSDAHRGFGFGR